MVLFKTVSFRRIFDPCHDSEIISYLLHNSDNLPKDIKKLSLEEKTDLVIMAKGHELLDEVDSYTTTEDIQDLFNKTIDKLGDKDV